MRRQRAIYHCIRREALQEFVKQLVELAEKITELLSGLEECVLGRSTSWGFEATPVPAESSYRSEMTRCRFWSSSRMGSGYPFPLQKSAMASNRIQTNAARFSKNYVIIVLCHPLSLIVFVASMAAWLFFYFLRGEPLVVLGCVIRDRVVLMVLAAVTLVPLLKTNATANILISLSVGLLLVVVHAALRRTDDAIVDAEGPCYAAIGSAPASWR
ncbi:hypothetical protein GW17_00017689 [Ensete ventricosum]|nr:hypothetical protein GW17_00017689 [Ensete ventricosum]